MLSLTIFEKNTFTLKELCNFIINSKINDEYINKELFSEMKENIMNLSKRSGDKELFSETIMKENTMNLSKRSGYKELFSEMIVKENTIEYDYNINKTILNEISYCYILFSSNNSNYRKFLITSRNNKGFLFKINNKIINVREILQIFDLEFTKLIIRIKTECNNYDIHITWDDFENKIGISKNQFKKLFYLEK
jgi:hypothetical protein